MMRKNTAKKISAFVSKLDSSSKVLIAGILDGTMSKADAIKQIDANIVEIQKIYKAVKTLASTKQMFIKASRDDNFEASVSSITSIATRLDLIKQVAESLDDEEDYSDISSEDILEDLGVEDVEEVVPTEEVVETPAEVVVPDVVEDEDEVEITETEAEMEETIEEIIEDETEDEIEFEAEEPEEEMEFEEEDGDVLFEGSKKSSASVKKIKKLVSKIKKTNDAGTTGLFDFINK